MSTRVLVNGAFGRMGQLVVKAITAHPKLDLTGQTGRDYNLGQAIKDSGAHVVVDFTHPDAVFQNTMTIIDAGARPVIGTSGLQPEEVKKLQKHCESAKLGGLVAPNFSLGAVLVMKAAQEMAKYMPNMEVIEMHHTGKLDSPSGTAMRMAEMAAEASPELNKNMKDSLENVKGARGAKHCGVPIHAVRLPGMLAHLQVLFGNIGEIVSLRHDSMDRECFMPGICLACEKVMEINTLAYGLEEIL